MLRLTYEEVLPRLWRHPAARELRDQPVERAVGHGGVQDGGERQAADGRAGQTCGTRGWDGRVGQLGGTDWQGVWVGQRRGTAGRDRWWVRESREVRQTGGTGGRGWRRTAGCRRTGQTCRQEGWDGQVGRIGGTDGWERQVGQVLGAAGRFRGAHVYCPLNPTRNACVSVYCTDVQTVRHSRTRVPYPTINRSPACKGAPNCTALTCNLYCTDKQPVLHSPATCTALTSTELHHRPVNLQPRVHGHAKLVVVEVRRVGEDGRVDDHPVRDLRVGGRAGGGGSGRTDRR